MRAAREQSTQSLVRNLLKANDGVLRISEIRDRIGLTGENGYGRVNNAVRDLVKAGEVEQAGYGRYQWAGEVKDAKFYKTQNAMWRFMWIRSKKNKPFTARDVHEISGAALYTAKTYITFLSKFGFLERAGKIRAFKTNAPLYLIPSEKMSVDAPVMRRKRETKNLEERLEKVRSLSSRFFRINDRKLETIRELIDTAQQLIDALWDCERIALGLTEREAQNANENRTV